MKFVPQIITCPLCKYQGPIITEDIHTKDIDVSLDEMTGCVRMIEAHINCPHCHQTFDVEFDIMANQGAETLFECNRQQNLGLQIWRRIENGNAKQPVFLPRINGCSYSEAELDGICRRIVCDYLRWKNQPQPNDDLAAILSQVEDYTQTVTWKKFHKRHYMVAVCAMPHTSKKFYFAGFNGDFRRVNNKNASLVHGLLRQLGGSAGSASNQFCNNPIGRCAEVHAANKCLNAFPGVKNNGLLFSIAHECRTGVPRSYCQNCITLFSPVLKNG